MRSVVSFACLVVGMQPLWLLEAGGYCARDAQFERVPNVQAHNGDKYGISFVALFVEVEAMNTWIFGRRGNTPAGPDVEETVEDLRSSTGLDAPGADLLASDPYALLTDGVNEGRVVGSALSMKELP